MKITFKPSGVCCREMSNLLGLKSLVICQNAHDVANKLANIPCGGKVTSCPDQLSKAINENIK